MVPIEQRSRLMIYGGRVSTKFGKKASEQKYRRDQGSVVLSGDEPELLSFGPGGSGKYKKPSKGRNLGLLHFASLGRFTCVFPQGKPSKEH